jgi:hypothetical protein
MISKFLKLTEEGALQVLLLTKMECQRGIFAKPETLEKRYRQLLDLAKIRYCPSDLFYLDVSVVA